MNSNKFTMYFGRDIVNGRAVSDLAVSHFLKEIVSPIFPGFTYQNTFGYWKGQAEKSFILTIISNDNPMEDILKIINWYKEEFSQEAVGLEITEVEFDFV